MTIEEKIAHLQTAAMEDARKEGNSIIERHREAHESIFEMHRAEALRQSETRIQAEVSSAKQQAFPGIPVPTARYPRCRGR